ncbi:MAG: hypothetical protein ABW061_04105 [Polyangiaceae bacterium]
MHTGDRARFLDSGELVLLGRVGDWMRSAQGTSVDSAEIADALGASFGPAQYVFAAVPERALLYVALPGARPALEPLSEADPHRCQFTQLLAQADPQQLVCAFALLQGVFGEALGEIGPTGKPRAHRIHALHSQHLRPTLPPSKKEEPHVPPPHAAASGPVLQPARLLD